MPINTDDAQAFRDHHEVMKKEDSCASGHYWRQQFEQGNSVRHGRDETTPGDTASKSTTR